MKNQILFITDRKTLEKFKVIEIKKENWKKIWDEFDGFITESNLTKHDGKFLWKNETIPGPCEGCSKEDRPIPSQQQIEDQKKEGLWWGQ